MALARSSQARVRLGRAAPLNALELNVAVVPATVVVSVDTGLCNKLHLSSTCGADAEQGVGRAKGTKNAKRWTPLLASGMDGVGKAIEGDLNSLWERMRSKG